MNSLVILTSTSSRHKFFANKLAENFKVVGIVSEEKVRQKEGETKEEDEIIKKHFQERNEAEEKYFGSHKNFAVDQSILLTVENGRTNDQDIFDWVKSKNPDYVVLFGSSIIKPPLLSYYDGKMINIHLGLSPYYRGSGTNFWPLVNNQPECVGATIHLAILKVDAGSILKQVRPEAEEEDRCHDLGCKTVIAGAQCMVDSIHQYHAGKIKPLPQNLISGQLCRRADFNAQAVLKMWDNFENGMMKEYLINKRERDAVYPIVD